MGFERLRLPVLAVAAACSVAAVVVLLTATAAPVSASYLVMVATAATALGMALERRHSPPARGALKFLPNAPSLTRPRGAEAGRRTQRGWTVPLMAKGRRTPKERTKIAEDKGYWQGEWICADCGYIYDDSLFGGLFFEEQTKGFKCPQCSGPRRRYAKKVGDTVGVTLDGGDGPILAASFGGLALTLIVGFYFTYN